MSWLPIQRPDPWRQESCDALELVIVPRARDLGGFEVRRALPHGKRQMVGPFIFFDQMGPVQFIAGQGMDVRPHPHIGLATVTYLFDGRDHASRQRGQRARDHAGRDEPHDGRARYRPFRAHAGRARDRRRQSMLGLQSWIALPARRRRPRRRSSISPPPACRSSRMADCGRGSSPARASARMRRSGCCPIGSMSRSRSMRAPVRRSTPTMRSVRSTSSTARSRSPAMRSKGRASWSSAPATASR